MPNTLITDPLRIWREAVTKMEGELNSLANRNMSTEEFARAIHQFSSVSLGMQQTFEKVLGAYFNKLNLPTRKEIAELSAAVQRVEDKLDRLLPPSSSGPAAPRPTRNRQPPPEAVEQPAAPAKAARKRTRG